MFFGVDYYPEHWERERWEVDADLIKEAGMNVVRLGEFAWSRLEPTRGRCNFGWLDEVIKLFADRDIKVVLCTPTAAPPAWLIERHPSILPRDESRISKQFGGRRHCCLNNPSFAKYVRKIVLEMVKHYKENQSVIGWQIDNEFGCHDTARCYCDNCTQAFREWLKTKFGSLSRLNEQWGTIFWSQEYNEWYQIPLPWKTIGVEASPPGKRIYAHNPSLYLDFYRFASDTIVQFQKMQISIIKMLNPNHFVTHNMMGLFDQINYFDLGEDIDFVSWDNYPGDGSDPKRVALAHDVMRGIKAKNFWVMEQQSGATGWWTHTQAPRPGQIRLWTYQAIAHGADGILYFRWRTCRFGTEQFWHGILDHDSVPRRRYYEIKRVGEEVQRCGNEWTLAESKNQVAIVVSYQVKWALEIQPHNPRFDYWNHICKFYSALYDLGVTVDIIRPEGDLEKYKLVIAPTLYLTRERITNGLIEYVKNGGNLILSFRSGVKNFNNVVTNASLPAGLNEMLGLVVTEYDSLKVGTKNKIKIVGTDNQYAIHTWADLIELQGARPLAHYTNDFYANTPAVTWHQFGAGRAFYIGTICEQPFYDDFLEQLCDDIRIPTRSITPASPEQKPNAKEDQIIPENHTNSLEVVRRVNDHSGKDLIFVLNHGNEVLPVTLNKEYHSLLEDKTLSGMVELEPYGVRVLSSE